MMDLTRANAFSIASLLEYRSAHDRIILTHEAYSRSGFVEGVVRAAEWLNGRKGVFGMDDLFSGV